MLEAPPQPMTEVSYAPDQWKWKRLRNVGVSLGFWPLEWAVGVRKVDDFFGGSIIIGFGPFVLTIDYNACTGVFGRSEISVPD